MEEDGGAVPSAAAVPPGADAAVAAAGVSGLPRARLLLRFLASLAVVNVVHTSGVLAMMEALVQAAVQAAGALSGERYSQRGRY